MTRKMDCFVAGLILVAFAAAAHAQAVAPPVLAPADHPILAVASARTAHLWRSGTEKFGESIVSEALRLRGYELLELKLPGNRGIDLIALKRNAQGMLVDVRLIEVKTHYGAGLPKLGVTRDGMQTSRRWFANRLMQMRSTGGQGRKLSLEISRFCKAQGLDILRLGEVHEVNLSSMKYTIRNPVTLTERAGPIFIPRLLNRIATRSLRPESQQWALGHIAQLDQVRQARMGLWLTTGNRERALARASTTPLLAVEGQQALRGTRGALVRAAGPMAFIIVAIDVYELYSHIRDYRSGLLSKRELKIALARSGGGIAAAWAGAYFGALTGTWVGGFGGPIAWLTIPAGGLVGGAAGGIGGYFAGSYVAETAARAWYRGLDRDLAHRIDEWITATANPFSMSAARASGKESEK